MMKDQIYKTILQQAENLILNPDSEHGSHKNHLISDLANLCALLHTEFSFLWTGFYLAHPEKQELYLGPFQGPLACTNIPFSKGVCGHAATTQKTIIVPNVHEFPGHIACSSLSQSEIVVPLLHNNQTQLVLDIDSQDLNSFDETDQLYLEKLIHLIQKQHYD